MPKKDERLFGSLHLVPSAAPLNVFSAVVPVAGSETSTGIPLELIPGDTVDLVVDPIFDPDCDEVQLTSVIGADQRIVSCEAPTDYVTVGGDCRDTNAKVHPGANEVGCNGIDDDCSPSTPDSGDSDADGVNSCTDCDDHNPAIFPGHPEVGCNGTNCLVISQQEHVPPPATFTASLRFGL